MQATTLPLPSQTPLARPRAGEFDARIVSNEPVNAEYRLMTVAVPDGAAEARPGQFFQILCPHSGALQPFFRRPMSIYRIDPAAGQLSFLYKVTGTGTRTMAELEAGDTINLFGPLGNGFTLPENGAPIVLLGRGVGLATMAPLVPFARKAGHAVTAILSARTPELVMSEAEFVGAGASVLAVTDSEGTSAVENVEDMLHALHAEGRLGALYVCGSNRLMLAAQRVARRLGLFGEAALEQQMACGVGMCFCCVRPFRQGDEIVHRRVCSEGPVFPLLEALEW
ncbi:dihydroorotate dehydrogenase electron transfer subunit [Jiella pelagia]|uniref:Dihydroorotate dehydrogenase electron transfer subunit n=1 Tax=Jiella pelagia TaxID=2986949 RepID=A0ABY7C320_9HYPH|nr:dihydroorotate dehydrogenase electron transfer subunit [Jiella pelagia]WAP69735.1 dihydroorotate dehydrogenase electron transfer subunit [Jiella pelagia]